MNAFLAPFIFILNLIAATLTFADERNGQHAIQITGHQAVVTLNAQTQQSSGIETIVLKPAHHHAEFIAYGKAIPIQPLLELHHRYLVNLTEHNRAAAKFKQAEQTIKRQQALYHEGAIAQRNVQDQQAQWQADKAQLDAIRFQSLSITDEALLNWGKVLSEWALSEPTDKLSSFLSGRKILLQITLPSNRQLAENSLMIAIDPSGNRSKAEPAELISVAPQTDAGNQGTSYFFQASGKRIKAGMSISAWLPEQQQSQSGVIIPKSALIWFMDQAFVYLKTDGETFSRRAIKDYSVIADGYFLSHTVMPDEQIVTIGGQMLLSEELRNEIPDDD
ncbi:MAG: hypothetical protein Q8N96_02760 [Methylovulum sp.]|nr:hypothetical protein [Methylovulum sp.]